MAFTVTINKHEGNRITSYVIVNPNQLHFYIYSNYNNDLTIRFPDDYSIIDITLPFSSSGLRDAFIDNLIDQLENAEESFTVSNQGPVATTSTTTTTTYGPD